MRTTYAAISVLPVTLLCLMSSSCGAENRSENAAPADSGIQVLDYRATSARNVRILWSPKASGEVRIERARNSLKQARELGEKIESSETKSELQQVLGQVEPLVDAAATPETVSHK